MLKEPSEGFLHMEEFAGLPLAGRAELAVGAEPNAASSDTDAAASSDADTAATSHAERELAATKSFLHAEELDSPPGFYNLWVL